MWDVGDEYGVAESWVRKHVFSFGGFCGIVPIGITLSYKLHMFDRASGEVKSSKEINLIPRVKIVGYVDSLFWVSPAAN
ncbi:hypothetical protein OSB04_018291 [Centaurea solstitialis]|uniref:Uncharacterized protein n=1 Tax=Centaurea solstitialis TaxID=347529 RepID=A0AA38TFG1_9ASTR|nr:hypothetical protein OSB04_018291 [Centaurea solstitialis]